MVIIENLEHDDESNSSGMNNNNYKDNNDSNSSEGEIGKGDDKRRALPTMLIYTSTKQTVLHTEIPKNLIFSTNGYYTFAIADKTYSVTFNNSAVSEYPKDLSGIREVLLGGKNSTFKFLGVYLSVLQNTKQLDVVKTAGAPNADCAPLKDDDLALITYQVMSVPMNVNEKGQEFQLRRWSKKDLKIYVNVNEDGFKGEFYSRLIRNKKLASVTALSGTTGKASNISSMLLLLTSSFLPSIPSSSIHPPPIPTTICDQLRAKVNAAKCSLV